MPPARRPTAGGRRKPTPERPGARQVADTAQGAAARGGRARSQPGANAATHSATSGAAPASSVGGGGFRAAVYAMIARIPRGRVATYGQIARLAGYPRRARHVGQALANTPPGVVLPWHRVITAQGHIARRGGAARGSAGEATAPAVAERRQLHLLQAEGVAFRGGRVDLLRFGWQPEQHALPAPPRNPSRRPPVRHRRADD